MSKERKKRILIIDDEKELAKLIKMRLESTGSMEVTLAFDGDEGLAKVEKVDPDVIILDIMMPGKNGFEVLEELRKDADAKRRPVIMLTARDDLRSMGTAYELQADHYLTKPFQTEDLLDAISTVLHLAAAWEESKKKKGENTKK